jgi:hypothetical protein
MDNQTKMFAILGAPCALAAAMTGFATYIAATLRDIPILTAGGPSPLEGFPGMIALGGASITAGLVAWQAWRVRQWLVGEAPECPHCQCLLGEPKQRRWSVCRKCLGCGRFAQTP